MYGLLECLGYSNAKKLAFEDLYENSNIKDQFLIRSTIAKALQDCPKIVPSHGIDQILCILTQYEQDTEETIRVFQGIMNCLHKFSYGMFTEDIKYKSLDRIADESLVGIGFFREYMEIRHLRKASPSVDYYSKMGALAYHRLGYEDLGDHFNGWTDFIEKEMKVTSIF